MPRPTKKELARIKVMADVGFTPNRIGNALGHDPKSIRAWMKKTDFNDHEIKALVDLIKARELDELRLIGGKARAILDQYLDSVLEGERDPNPISITAILDRTFGQRRLIENLSTENISYHTTLEHLNRQLAEVDEELKKLEGGK